MGNNNQTRTASFPNGDQRIGHPSICPKCGVGFPPTITYNIVINLSFSSNCIWSSVLVTNKLYTLQSIKQYSKPLSTLKLSQNLFTKKYSANHLDSIEQRKNIIWLVKGAM